MELQWGTVPDWAIAVVTLLGFGLTLLALKNEFDRRRQDAAMKVGASTDKISMYEARTTFTNGNDAPIYNVEIIVTFILNGSKATQRFEEPMVHPGTHTHRWGIDGMAVLANTEIRFTDGNGHRWSRTQQGVFKDLGVIEFA